MKPIEKNFFASRLGSPQLTESPYITTHKKMAGSLNEWRDGLIQVHREKLYKERFDSFDIYCETVWGFTGRHGRNLVNGRKDCFRIEDSEKKGDSNTLENDDPPEDPCANAKPTNGSATKPKPSSKEKPAKVDYAPPAKEEPKCPVCQGTGKLTKKPSTTIPD